MLLTEVAVPPAFTLALAKFPAPIEAICHRDCPAAAPTDTIACPAPSPCGTTEAAIVNGVPDMPPKDVSSQYWEDAEAKVLAKVNHHLK